MSQATDENDVNVTRYLAGAAQVISRIRYCWLITQSKAGEVKSRPMGCAAFSPDPKQWRIRLLADGRSRKSADIRSAPSVDLIFQHGRDEAYVTLRGSAALIDDPAELKRCWRDAYDPYFPGKADRENAVFIDVTVARMTLWIRGVTPEPFGMRPTIIEQKAGGAWRLIDRDAA